MFRRSRSSVCTSRSSSSQERDHSIREDEIALLNVSVGGYKIDGVMPHAHRLALEESAVSVPD